MNKEKKAISHFQGSISLVLYVHLGNWHLTKISPQSSESNMHYTGTENPPSKIPDSLSSQNYMTVPQNTCCLHLLLFQKSLG